MTKVRFSLVAQFVRLLPSRTSIAVVCVISIILLMIAMAILFRETANISADRILAEKKLAAAHELTTAAKSVKLARLEWLLDPTPSRAKQFKKKRSAFIALLMAQDRGVSGDAPSENLTKVLQLVRQITAITPQLSDDELRRSFLNGELRRLSDAIFHVLTKEQIHLSGQIARRRDLERRNQSVILQVSIVLGTLIIAQAAQVTQRLRYERTAAVQEIYLEKLAEERDRADILARELSHRVKNLFSVISSIVSMTARGETDAQLAAQKACARINALAIAHNLATQNDIKESSKTYTVSDLVNRVVEPFCSNDGTLIIKGSNVVLKPAMVTPLGLIANELATNALKYGAWSTTSGTVTIDINCIPQSQMISVLWAETGGPSVSTGHKNAGFGTTMIDLSVRQIGGTLERVWHDDGLQVRISFEGQVG